MNQERWDAFLITAFQLPQLSVGIRRIFRDDANHAVTTFDPRTAVRLPAAAPGFFDRIVGEANINFVVALLPHEEISQYLILHSEADENALVGHYNSPVKSQA